MKPRLEIHLSIAQQCRFAFGKPYQPSGEEYLLNHGRCGIFLAVKSLGLPFGAKVGVMAYNCPTVMNAVEQAGCTPFFLDVTDEMKLDEDDLGRKVSELSAIIITHLFGIVNDVKRIRTLYPDLVIIEDCAHAYGLEEFWGDFVTFSIGQGKFPTIGDGGILKVLNEKYKGRIESLYSDLPDYNELQSMMLLLKLMVRSQMYSRFFYGWLTLPIKRRRGIQKPKADIVPMKMCKGIGAVFFKERNNVSQMIAMKMCNAQRLMSKLPEGVTRSIIGQNAFMLVLHCDNLDLVQEYYRKQGIDTATHFKYSIYWAKEFGYLPGQCPNAEKLVNKLLMVPVYN